MRTSELVDLCGKFESEHLASTEFSRFVTATQAGASNTDQKAVTGNASLAEIYHNFILAFESTIAFRLVRQTSLVPVFSNLLVKADFSENSLDSFETSIPALFIRTSSYLTCTGVLVFSISPVDLTDPLGLPSLTREHEMREGATLVLAPGFVPVVCCGRGEDQFDLDISAQWRNIVVSYLKWKGLNLSGSNRPQFWILVRQLRTRYASDEYVQESPAFLWPTCLCFTLSEESRIQHDTGTHGGVDTYPSVRQWFDNDKSLQGSNMLEFVAHWVQTQPEREQQIASRKQQEKDTYIMKNTLTPTSPINSRSITYGETHGVAGVYPTPPDGISSQPVPGIVSMDTPLGNAYDSLSHNVEMKSQMLEPEAVKASGLMTSHTMQLDGAMKLEDDPFGDINDDDFVGNDITDADFNFFDQPDGPELGSDGIKEENLDDNDLPTSSNPTINLSITSEANVEGQLPHSSDNKDTQAGEDIEMTDAGIVDIAEIGAKTATVADTHLISLTPAEIQRRLFVNHVDGTNRTRIQSQAEHSAYEPLSFSNRLDNSDAKYSSSGTFSFGKSSVSKQGVPKSEDIRSKISLPKSNSNPVHDSTDASSSYTNDSDESIDIEISSPRTLEQPRFSRKMESGQEFIDLVMADGQKDLVMPGETNHPSLDDLIHTAQDLFFEDNTVQLQAFGAANNFLKYLQRYSKEEVNLTKLATPSRAEKSFIMAAQIVVDQLILSSLDIYDQYRPNNSFLINEGFSTPATTSLIVELQQCSKALIGLNDVNSFVKYSSIQDTPADQASTSKGQPRQNQPKAPAQGSKSDGTSTGLPIRLIQPFVRIRRNEALWDMVSPALAFWDTLGLSPSGSSKNIVSYCIYPSSTDLRTITDQFMKELASSYESSRLGTHTRGLSQSSEALENGLVPWKINTGKSFTVRECEDSLRNLSRSLATKLASSRKPKVPGANSLRSNQPEGLYSFLVYIINPFDDDPTSVAMIASSFYHLFSVYTRAIKSDSSTWIPDIQLQIIPISYLVRNGQLVVRQPIELQALAREVYNRCPPTSLLEDSASLPIPTGWSVHLSEALPRKISFELKSEAPQNIMHDNSHLHVGYAQSASGNWITAAYTDNSGRYQYNASYCMAGGRGFVEVAKEIWQTCIEIMQVRGVNWRLCISKVGPMDALELGGVYQASICYVLF
jgi:mediator of RNA polymerase II transcription subunit 13, fungi type